MALRKGASLKKGGDFRLVFRSHKGAKARNLLLKAKPAHQDSSRFGIVIGKQVSKKAVERNRLRRLLQEALKDKAELVSSPHDIVLVALPGFSLSGLLEAKALVKKLFEQTFSKKSA